MGESSKAIVAVIMAVLILIEQLTGFHFPGVNEEWITVLLAVLTPILVYFVPNR